MQPSLNENFKFKVTALQRQVDQQIEFIEKQQEKNKQTQNKIMKKGFKKEAESSNLHFEEKLLSLEKQKAMANTQINELNMFLNVREREREEED